jgi:hypothetical protein
VYGAATPSAAVEGCAYGSAVPRGGNGAGVVGTAAGAATALGAGAWGVCSSAIGVLLKIKEFED